MELWVIITGIIVSLIILRWAFGKTNNAMDDTYDDKDEGDE